MKRVLIADDNAASRELIRIVLEECGHVVIEARDGAEALRDAQKYLPDLIILDLHMPILDGYGVLEELRRDPQFVMTPIIALTASAMRGNSEHALKRGFTTYITKPVDLRSFRRQIDHALGES